MIIDLNFLKQLQNLEIVTKKKVSNIYAGYKRSLLLGKGVEPEDYREYYYGDDFRAVDWKLYARTEKLYIRRFSEDKDLSIHILLDSSKSMDFSFIGVKKFHFAANLAAALAFVSIAKNERFGAGIFSNRLVDVLHLSKSRKNFFKFIELLNSMKLQGKTNISESFEQYSKHIKSRSLLFIISDFLDDLNSIRKGIFIAARKVSEGAAIQILDPAELKLPWREDIEFLDLEMWKEKKTYITPKFNEEYESKVRDHILKVEKICKDAGLDHMLLTTEKELLDSFLALLGRKILMETS